jgi:hypothetical protein
MGHSVRTAQQYYNIENKLEVDGKSSPWVEVLAKDSTRKNNCKNKPANRKNLTKAKNQKRPENPTTKANRKALFIQSKICQRKSSSSDYAKMP